MPDALKRLIPLIDVFKNREPGDLQSDLMAGVTTAIMLVPQAMAYAMLAGLEPIVGLYASTIPLFLYGLMGSSRQLAVGPVAMVSLLVASAVTPLADGDAALYLALAGTLALMVGVMQLLMGVFKLGFLVKFMSHPVIAGFTSAAALIIGLSQLKHVLGVDIHRSHHVHEIVLQAFEQAGNTHPITFGIAIASIVTLVSLKKLAPRFPRFLLVVVAGTLSVWGLGLDDQGVAIVGSVPSGLPGLSMPALDMAKLQALLPMAITISLVGFMESISVAKAFARANRYDVDADQELKALGVANLAASVMGGYPITGGFSRTAVNAQAGAKSGVAGIVTSAIVVLTLLFLTPLFTFLPKAVLASIIMTAVFGLIDFKEAKHLWEVSRPDLAAMALAFVATLTLGIEQGILVGVSGALLWFVWNTSKPHVAVLGRLPGTNIYRNVERYPDAETVDGVVALRIDAPLYFANTAFLEGTIRELVTADTKHLVIDCKVIGSVDAQALTTLHDILLQLQEAEVTVWLAGVRGPVRDALKKAHIWNAIGEEHIAERVAEAIEATETDGRPRLVG